MPMPTNIKLMNAASSGRGRFEKRSQTEFPMENILRMADQPFRTVSLYISGWAMVQIGKLHFKAEKKWICVHNGKSPVLTIRKSNKEGKVEKEIQLSPTTELRLEKDQTFTLKAKNDVRTKFRMKSPAVFQNWMDVIYQAISHGSWLKHIRVVHQLGYGSFSKVMLCSNTSTHEQYALKVVDGAIEGNDEIKILQKVQRLCPHTNVGKIVRVFENQDRTCIVMPVYKGGSLFDSLKENKRFDEGKAAAQTLSIAKALHAIHKCNIVHCDIKLENIMLTGSGDVRLIDFGGAIDLTTVTYEKRIGNAGTPGYISPERIAGKAATGASDVFSLGIILYQLLSGRHPFLTDSSKLTIETSKAYDTALSGKAWKNISWQAKSLVRSMLNRDPKKRIRVSEILSHPWINSTPVLEDEFRQAVRV